MSLTPERTAELQELCRQYRIDVLTAIHGAQSGHPGGCISSACMWTPRTPTIRTVTGSCSVRAMPRPCSTAT